MTIDRTAGRRVDLAVFYLHLRMGGVPRLAIWLANAFSRRGLCVDLVVGTLHQACAHDVSPDVRLVNLQAHGILEVFLRLTTYLRRSRPKVMMSFVANAIAVAGAANWMAGRVSFFLAAEQIDTAMERRNARWGPYQIATWLVPLTYRLADALTASSAGVGRSLGRVICRDPARIPVVYSPAYRPEIMALQNAELDHPWFQDAGQVVVTAARFVEQKDLPTLLRAFQRVSIDNPAVRLIILGDGPQRQQLLELRRTLGLDGVVDLPGADPNPYRWFKRSALFVLSSRWEGFGMTIVEAMACGCPVVSTDCPSGPSEILQGGTYGRLVPVANDRALAAAIRAALAERHDADRLRQRASAFSLDATVDGYWRLFHDRI